MKLEDCRIIDLPKIKDARGNLTFIEQNRHIPFNVERVYYLYDIPGGEARGGHAHKQCQEFLVAVNGSFDVVIDNGKEQKKIQLNRSYYGLYLPAMTWRELENFSSGSVCLVLASHCYEEDDYIRNYDDFLGAKQ